MKYIAHRGLFGGPDAKLENRPEQIELALSRGYDCEIDVRYKADGGWFLGHDEPLYPVDYEFITQEGLWLHAKNLAALYFLTETTLNYFWHENDERTVTGHQYIWTYPGKTLSKRSIMLMPEWDDPDLESTRLVDCYGICSDYIEKIIDLRK
jgi:glycerophosphoryl diester phosphodiesterase